MIAAISGAGGFIGRALTRSFREKGWTVRTIDRESFTLPDPAFTEQKIESADVVINLAGAPVSKRWNNRYKEEILRSRVQTTRKIIGAIEHSVGKPGLFICASAVGIYDSRETHTEESQSFASTYLSYVCQQWESEAIRAATSCRVVTARLGVVLGKEGGALKSMYFPFSIGLGGKIGNGRQAVSFIHLDDLVDAFHFLIETPAMKGPVNLVSPYPTDNTEFTETLSKVLRQPAWLTIPGILIKTIFGEGAKVLLDGQRAVPAKLTDAGFQFRHPTIRNAMVAIYG
ncbi:MAG TPA: TIGR01777 family oxidoreductase [Bacteroidales bacterium]|nr:TIGR01777 family oxidoreductase [Bacteroidales bacterium]